MRFAEALRAIVSQQLLPEKDEKGRVPAVEILIATPAIRECLQGRGPHWASCASSWPTAGSSSGTQTFEQHLADLVEAGLITPETAKAAARAQRTGAPRRRPSGVASRPQSA